MKRIVVFLIVAAAGILFAGEKSGSAECRIIEGVGCRNIDREIARRMDEKFDSGVLGETYAELLKAGTADAPSGEVRK